MSRVKVIGLGAVTLLGQAGLYAAASRLGWEFVLPSDTMSILWPAAGVAIALMLRGGWIAPAAIILGSLGMSWVSPYPLPMFGVALGAVTAGAFGAWLYRRVLASARLEWLGQHRENAACLAAAVFAPQLSIVVVSLMFWQSGFMAPHQLVRTFWVWWTGDMVGVLIFLPLCEALRSAWITRPSGNRVLARSESGRLLFISALIAVTGTLIYQGYLQGPLLLGLWLLLLVINCRFGGVWMKLALAVWTVTLALAVAHGSYGDGTVFLTASLPALQLFLGLLALGAMLVTGFGSLCTFSWPGLVLLVGWIAAFLSYGNLTRHQAEVEQLQIDQKVSNTQSAIEERLYAYAKMLRGAAAALEVSGPLDRANWKRYCSLIQRDMDDLGLLGLGVVLPVRAEEADEFVRTRRAAGLPGFQIHPVPDVTPPPPDDAGYAHFVVAMIEPEQRNQWRLGLDLASEARRQEAASHARDTGELHATESLRLTVDGQTRPGFAAFMPVFRPGRPLLTEQQRRDALIGWIYALSLADQVFGALSGLQSSPMDYSIYEGRELTPDKLLYQQRHAADTRKPRPAAYDRVSRIEVMQVEYSIGWRQHKPEDIQSGLPALFAAGGILLASVLLAGLVISLQDFGRRANHLVEERTAELQDSNRRLTGINQALRDAERIISAQNLETRKHAMIANRTVNAIALTDANRVIEWVNESFARVTGYRAAEAIGRKPGELIFGPNIDPDLAEKFEAGMRTGNGFVIEVGCRHKAGTEVWLNLEVQPVTDADGRLTGYMYIATDMTENKSYRALLEQALHRAESSSRSKTAFLGNISHELRTPLNVIRGNTTLMLAGRFGAVNESQARSLRLVQENSAHLLSLIDDLLDITKAENGRIELVIQAVNVRGLCQEVVGMLAEAAAAKDIRLGADCRQQAEVIGADPLRLKQVLLNLLSNAVKFTPEGGSVMLQVTQTALPPQIVFQVIDTGFGLNREEQERIFLEFEQATTPLRRAGSGTGLGLPIARRFAQLHGGTVTVESTEGRGSIFTVCLPLREAPPSEPVAPQSIPVSSAPPPGLNPADFLILAVEDYPANLELLVCYLEGEGYRAASAVNGLQAIEQALALQPNLILMDVKMPGLDGLEATRRLREDPRTRDIPVVSLTAFASESDAKACSDAGATAYVTKPVDFEQLGAVIRRHLQPAPGTPALRPS